MRTELIDVMQDQVRTIYRAVTGTDVPEPESSGPPSDTPFEEVTRRFVELEALARTDPFVSELVPPFSFTPPLDAFCHGDQIVVELAVPGVERDDLHVEIADGMIVISGVRRTQSDNRHKFFSHAEIPRGPFYREFHVPVAVHPQPDVTLERGLLRIQLNKALARPTSDDAGSGNSPGDSQH
jgi:HSP20 family molecular chaperone IbpA